jgi:predicted amidohydrolase YtcJ
MAGGAADLVVVGATIHSVDDADGSAKAFAIRGDRFAYVGSVAGAIALRGPTTRVLDLAGRTVVPGLIDAHLHLTNLGLELERVDLRLTRSFEEVVARTAAFAQSTSDDWILGRGWDQNLWPSREFPTHGALSDAIPDRPVALARVDGHALIANSRAMAIAGIDERTAEPAGGRILHDDRGAPTGLFVDAAQALIYDKVPRPRHDRLVRAARAAIAECNRWGVTAVAEPGCDASVLAAHRELLESDGYSIRNYAMLQDEPALIDARARSGIVDAAYGGRLWVRAIKMYADGALGSRGAALLAPYSDDPGNFGLILTPRERIENVTESALRAGFQVCVHAIGDRANRLVLDAYEAALQHSSSNRDARLRIEHAQVIAPEDVSRFTELGVIASMQATHAVSDMAWAETRLGPRRILGAYAWRSVLDGGAMVANGTDAPVESVNPSRTFHASIARQWHPEQRMTRREALASMTIWPARANFQERLVGSIASGKYADFVVIDRDWMTVAPEEILQTQIVCTYFGGRCVYGAGSENGHNPTGS